MEEAAEHYPEKAAQISARYITIIVFWALAFALTGGEGSCASKNGPVANSSALLSFLQQLQQSALQTLGSSGFDPKLYVDLPLRYNLSVATQAFLALPQPIPKKTLSDFLGKYFGEAGDDIGVHPPPDFVTEPDRFLSGVKNQAVRKWALQVHSLWNVLSRKVNKSVGEEPDDHTLLPLPEALIIPGSRFREVYYWDSYWIIS